MQITLRRRWLVAVLLASGPLLVPLASCRRDAAGPGAGVPVNASSVEVYFSPKGGCTDAIVRELEKAKTSIRMQAYSFTSARIATALIEARKRGVPVEAVLDKSNQ